MNASGRYIRIFRKDGSQPGAVHGDDVDTVLKALQGHIKPSTIGFEQSGKVLEGDYFEVSSSFRVELDSNRFQYFHEGQILVVVGAYDKRKVALNRSQGTVRKRYPCNAIAGEKEVMAVGRFWQDRTSCHWQLQVDFSRSKFSSRECELYGRSGTIFSMQVFQQLLSCTLFCRQAKKDGSLT
jgi:hypothetical protein